MSDTNVLTCQTCGGALQYSADGLHAVCPYCGNEYFFKRRKSDALSLALNRANLMRRECDFDGAITEYKLILSHDGTDAEAHWGLALSIYGIEYVQDTRTQKRIPTCRRAVKQSILANENYLAAVKYADETQAQYYKSQAAIIDRLQRDIMRKMEGEENFDVFLCYRSADDHGYPTKERMIARRIYDELTKRGFKTFFSEITLKDRLGDDYEPIIYKALYSCKFFVLIACDGKNINAPWVKNEWARYRDRMAEEGLSGCCCAVFEGTVYGDLPQFLRSAQGINLAKYPAGGYEIELADNLAARFGTRNTQGSGYPGAGSNGGFVGSGFSGASFSGANYTGGSAANRNGYELETLLKHAKSGLLNGFYDVALDDYKKITASYPACAEAWWGCFLAKQRAPSWEVAAQNTDYTRAMGLRDDRYLANAITYADGALSGEIECYKKACINRCNQLSLQFERNAQDIEGKIKENDAKLADIASKKAAAAVKRESYSKFSDDAKFKKYRNTIFFSWVFVCIFFVVIAIFLAGSAGFIFAGMVGLCVFAAAVMLIIVGKSRKKFAAKADELGRQVSGYYAQEKRLQAESEAYSHEAEEERRKANELKKVFNS